MTDLVEMLKKRDCKSLLDAYDAMEEAADEIERLNEQLQTVFIRWQDEKENWRQELTESGRNDLFSMRLLAEGQAREAKLREGLSYAASCLRTDGYDPIDKVLAMPTDDTALKEVIKQAKREALLEAAEAEWWDKDIRVELRRMAGEIK
jgi:hypothetical protein